jgi:Na+/proline symporter
VQRYTSVATPKDAKKVGWLFGTLYLLSPVLWMLPPMIYRIYNPSLNGLADEGAYLLMCKEALPLGMLGLMLGGMIFATASSLNATLNISAGVFTNDIFKPLFTSSNDKKLMRVARISTIAFGVLAIIVALMVQKMGGIVNVVISVAALTGVPLYLPVIWSLFSKRQNKRTILFATLFSLTLNLFIKFAGQYIGIVLNREEEMIMGVSLPIVILVVFELYFFFTNKTDPQYISYSEGREIRTAEQKNISLEDTKETERSNRYGKKVIGISISSAAMLIVILGFIATSGKLLVLSIGAILLALGVILFIKNKTLKKTD